MRWMRRALDELDGARRDPARAGIWIGLAAGLAVAAPVARCFLGFGQPFEEGLAFALPLSGLAFACTTAGTIVAVRARSTGVAVAWCFAANVVPPTLVCMPTVIGMFVSVPSGLAAFVVTLPLVLIARRSVKTQQSGQAAWERLWGALLLSLVAAGLAGYESEAARTSYVQHEVYAAPAILSAAAALLLALGSAAPDAYRLWLRGAVRLGRVPGVRLTGEGIVERFDTAGEGPMRTAPTKDAIGRLNAPPLRLALGMTLTLVAAAALVASLWTLTLEGRVPQLPY